MIKKLRSYNTLITELVVIISILSQARFQILNLYAKLCIHGDVLAAWIQGLTVQL